MKRNYGIDILKIFMMFLIVCGHVIWHGGYWNLVASDGPVYILVIDVVAACAVNCYAMSSGFLLYDSNPNKKKLLSLWKQVFFYSITLFLFIGIRIDFSFKNMVSSFLPIIRNQYWYFTSYVVVFVLAPYIN